MLCLRRQCPIFAGYHLQAGTMVAPLKIHSIALSDPQFPYGVQVRGPADPKSCTYSRSPLASKGQGSNSQLTGNGIKDISSRQVFRHK